MSSADSRPVPPRSVLYARASPAGASLVMNASVLLALEVSYAPGVVGKPVPAVPVTYALPAASTAIPLLTSPPAPPRNVLKSRAVPVGFNRVTNTSLLPLWLVSKAPAVVGKAAPADPVTYARPFASIAMSGSRLQQA